MSTRDRFQGLDVLRAVALILVLIRHSVPCPASVSLFWRELSLQLQLGSWTGVDLFFVLSGFLIGRLLFQEFQRSGEINLHRFFVRRGFKIYPHFWIFIAFISCWRSWKGMDITLADLLPELLFFQNYVPAIGGVTWSLGVEEHFYLLLPFILGGLIFLDRRSPRGPCICSPGLPGPWRLGACSPAG